MRVNLSALAAAAGTSSSCLIFPAGHSFTIAEMGCIGNEDCFLFTWKNSRILSLFTRCVQKQFWSPSEMEEQTGLLTANLVVSRTAFQWPGFCIISPHCRRLISPWLGGETGDSSILNPSPPKHYCAVLILLYGAVLRKHFLGADRTVQKGETPVTPCRYHHSSRS